MDEVVKVGFKASKDRIKFDANSIKNLLEQKEKATLAISFLGKKLLVTTDLPLIKHILVDNPTVYTRSLKSLANIIEIFGKFSLGTLQNLTEWKKEREIIMELFKPANTNHHFDTIVKTFSDELSTWNDYVISREPFPINQRISEMATRVLLNVMFNGVKADEKKIVHLGTEIMRLSSPQRYFKTVKLFNFIPLPDYFKFLRIKSNFDHLATNIVTQSLNENIPNDNLIKHLSNSYQYPPYAKMDKVTKQRLLDETITFLISAPVGATSLMGYICIYLSRHPEIMEKLHKEIEPVLGNKLPNYDDLEKMPLVRAFVREVLRKHPPAKFISREAQADMEFQGRRIKKGDIILIHIHSLHNLSCYWPDPDAFEPERFLHTLTADQQAAYMPFGRGPRSCVAAQFVPLEGMIFLILLVQRYKVKLSAGYTVIEDPELNEELDRRIKMDISASAYKEYKM